MFVYFDHYSQKKLTSLPDSYNYRAIALISLFGKHMDVCIIDKQYHVFEFYDLFAYKANHSMCVYYLRDN